MVACIMVFSVSCSPADEPSISSSTSSQEETSNSEDPATDGAGQSEESETSQTQSLSEQDLQTIAKNCTDALLDAEFTTVYEYFGSLLKLQLSTEALQSAWEQTIAGQGDFQEIVSDEILENNGLSTVQNILRYEKTGIRISYTFDQAGQIQGLWFGYTTISDGPESTEIFTEYPIEIGTGEIKLGGFLTLPNGIEKPPVIILIQGSGQSDRNETVGAAGNAPFRDLAHGLAAQGIATIRYDKRYFAFPELVPDGGLSLTIEDEVLEDAGDAVRFAAEDGRVDADRIYLLGHSMGGMLAPKIAADHPEIQGIISMAGTLRKLEDLMLDQNREALASMDNLSEEERQTVLQQVEEQVQKIKNLQPGQEPELLMGAYSPYWLSLNAIDSQALVQSLSIPMLIMQGGMDFQVYPDPDYLLWQETLQDRNNVSFQFYDHLNHLFMPSSGKRDVSDYDTANQVDPQVIADIAAWIHSLAVHP